MKLYSFPFFIFMFFFKEMRVKQGCITHVHSVFPASYPVSRTAGWNATHMHHIHTPWVRDHLLNIFKNIFWRVEITATCFTLLPNHQPPQSIDTCVFLYISVVVFFIHSDSLSFFGFIFIFFSTNNPISIDWVVFYLIFFFFFFFFCILLTFPLADFNIS